MSNGVRACRIENNLFFIAAIMVIITKRGWLQQGSIHSKPILTFSLSFCQDMRTGCPFHFDMGFLAL
jgi:hypothetical protein